MPLMDAFVREQTLVAVLARIAWADGTLHRGEADFFLETLGQLAFDPAHLVQIYPLLLRPRPISELPVAQLTPEDQRWLLSFGCQMAASDGAITDAEVAELQEFTEACGIPPEDLCEQLARWET